MRLQVWVSVQGLYSCEVKDNLYITASLWFGLCCLMTPGLSEDIRCHVIWCMTILFSSADPKVSSAELMVLLICPSSVVVVRRRPSVNFCFKSLLLLQFLFDHSEFFTGETRHIVPPCNKAGISNFCLELQKLQKFQISWKRYSSFSSYSIILKFILEKLGI